MKRIKNKLDFEILNFMGQAIQNVAEKKYIMIDQINQEE